MNLRRTPSPATALNNAEAIMLLRHVRRTANLLPSTVRQRILQYLTEDCELRAEQAQINQEIGAKP